MFRSARSQSRTHYKQKMGIQLENKKKAESQEKLTQQKIIGTANLFHPFRMNAKIDLSINYNNQKAKGLKNIIDEYFQEESGRMPIINTKKTQRQVYIFRRKQKKQPSDEELSKSVNNLPLEENKLAESNNPKANGGRLSHSSIDKHLPPIFQQVQGAEELSNNRDFAQLNMTFHSSVMNKSSSVFSQYINPQKQTCQQRLLVFENEIFSISLLLENKRAVGRLKQYKQNGYPVMERQLKMKDYDVETLWKENKYSHHSFITSQAPPIKDLLCKIFPDEVNTSQLKLRPRPIHKSLLANNCQQLIIMIKNFCKELNKIEGKIINNKINPANLFVVKGMLTLSQWGYASFRQEFNIQSNKFETRRYGILRGQRDWFVSPEYLAPQIIRQILQSGEEDIWQCKGSPDIWSLGLTIFEIITLIPVWINANVSVTTKPAIVRKGILGVPERQLNKLLEKQLKIQKVIRNYLYSEIDPCEQNQNLFKVILQMVQPNKEKRISLDQIIISL